MKSHFALAGIPIYVLINESHGVLPANMARGLTIFTICWPQDSVASMKNISINLMEIQSCFICGKSFLTEINQLT